jgi:5-methylcytosine-specific restriction endonuclease McrA
MIKNLKEKIIELKFKGFSYKQIQKKLNCSKGTISYHCGVGQKEKNRSRQKNYRNQNVLKKKIEGFNYRKNKINNEIEHKNKKIKEILKSRIMRFSRMENGKYKKLFNEQQLLEKIGNEPKCYLTGRPIDLSEPRSYNLDHITPRTKGGDNSLENCGIACKEANQAKHNLLLEDFINLCKEVVQNNPQI